MSNNVSTLYSGVIKDVIENVKKDFEDSGTDIQVLYALQRIWDSKIRDAKVATWEQSAMMPDDSDQNCAPIGSALYAQSDSGGLKSYETQSVGVATLPIAAAQNIHPNHNNMNSYQIKNSNNGNPVPVSAPPQSYPPPAPDISNRSGLISNQADAANTPPIDQKIYSHSMSTTRTHQENEKLVPRDPHEASSNNSPPPEFVTHNIDTDEITSDLDDTEDEDANADSEDTQNIILCLYDKVTRTKNKWKCQLKDGIMSVNGRDYLFQKGNGDFEF